MSLLASETRATQRYHQPRPPPRLKSTPMSQNYAQLVTDIINAAGEWFEIEDSRLSGNSLVARRASLHQLMRVRGLNVQTRTDDAGRLYARMTAEGTAKDLMKRLALAKRYSRNRVQTKRISGRHWFRVLSGKDNEALNVNTFKLKSKLYMVPPTVEAPTGLCKLVNLYTATTSRDQYFLLCIPKRQGIWYKTDMEAIRQATTQWINVQGHRGEPHTVFTGCARTTEPDWSKVPPFAELVASAFKGRIVFGLDAASIAKLFDSPDDGVEDFDDGRVSDEGEL